MSDFDYFKKQHLEANENLNFANTKVEDHEEEIIQILDGKYIVPLTTGISKIDSHFNMFAGMLFCVSGYPQSGKSEFCNYLLINHVVNGGGKCCVFSPESDTPILKTEYINTLSYRMKIEWRQAKAIVNDYFIFIEIKDDQGMPDIKNLIDNFSELSKEGFNFFLIDPMNWVTSSMYTNQGSFESLRLTLTYLKQFAKASKSIVGYVEHPKTPIPNRDGSIPSCSVFSINGGVMHNNKCDAILILHRQRQIDENGKNISSNNDPILLEVAKLKMQKYLGTPSTITLEYDWKTGIYS